MKTLSVVAKYFRADSQTDVTKPAVIFLNFVATPRAKLKGSEEAVVAYFWLP